MGVRQRILTMHFDVLKIFVTFCSVQISPVETAQAAQIDHHNFALPLPTFSPNRAFDGPSLPFGQIFIFLMMKF